MRLWAVETDKVKLLDRPGSGFRMRLLFGKQRGQEPTKEFFLGAIEDAEAKDVAKAFRDLADKLDAL